VNKRVLLVGNFLSSSVSNQAMCEDLASWLATTGWRVLTTSSSLGRFSRLTDMVKTVWQRRKMYDVAIMDVFSGPSFLWAYAVSRTLLIARKPFALALRGGNLPSFAQKWPKPVTQLLCSANVVTAPSGYLLEQMRTYRDDIALLPNPINLSQYSFRLRVHPKPNLVWLRAFHTIYNPTLAPRILTKLVPEFPEIGLTMVGPDKGDGSLQETQQIAAALNIADRIEYPGHVRKEKVPYWLNQGDMFLNTTNVDNTPVSVMEAMASGLCIVSTNVGGIPYLLCSEQDSLLIEPDNAEQGAAAIRRILTQPDLAARLSQNAYNKVRQFDWPIVLKQWEDLLLTISSHD
jgi:glycosyltransferase involved in cell wall biosynthesis